MTTPISNATSLPYVPQAQQQPVRARAGNQDSDGDNDGSKVGEVEQNKPASSGTIGTTISTKA